jgi:hypothetical protein
MGLAGDFTPIMTSFMQYTFQLTEKLHREFHTAFMKSTASAAERTEARRFLGAHLAAITTLAGSLGMPMATVFARVMDKMVDLMSDDEDEPFNSIAAYRNWLASIFGKDVAEVIARGVPRVLNVDISERVGEQHLLPYAHAFSKLMTDRRTWEDATKDWALQTMGSPVGMVTNILNGGEKLAQGKVWDGVEQMVPNAIKGPVKAYRLTERGYVDGKGNALPMEPGALEIMGQLLGFSPASKAEYNEERGVMATLRGNRSRAANVIRNELVTALQAGDMQTARAAYKRAIAFDRANPDFAILPRLDSVLKARQREAERAQNLKSPLGTKPGLADRATFGNY